MMMGLIIGIVLGALAGAKPQVILQTGIGLAAVMYLMPKMVACLMEGLMPISQAAQELMSKKFAGREVFIGLDAAVWRTTCYRIRIGACTNYDCISNYSSRKQNSSIRRFSSYSIYCMLVYSNV